MHCSTGQGKMHSPLFSAALQIRLTASTMSLQLHLCRFALHTGVQCCNTVALQHWSGQNAFPTVQCCSANQAHSRHCDNAVTPMEICYSYRCAVSQLKCSATLVWAKCIPHCSVVLCKTGSQQACVSAIAPVEILSSYRCAVSQQKCSPALVWAKCIPHCSAKQAHSRLVLLQQHLWRFALHTGVQ